MSKVKLKEIFVKTFEIPEEQVDDSLAYMSIPLWDSIGHMALIAALDQEFNVLLDTQDIIDMSSFGKVKDILTKYGVDFS